MAFTPPDVQLAAIAPEIALAVAALVLLVLDGFVGDLGARRHLPILTTIALAIAGWLAIDQWGASETQLSGMVALDGFAIFVKVTLVVFALLTVWCARDHLTRVGIEEGEFYALVLFVTAGMMMMASAADLIVMFLA